MINEENLYYTKDHEWLRVEDNIGYVGITDFAQSELGEIVFVDVQTEGETIPQFEPFGSIEAVKTVSDLNIPVTGKVLEFNNELDSNPGLVNSNPYEEGWIIKIEISNPKEINNLLTHKQYKELL